MKYLLIVFYLNFSSWPQTPSIQWAQLGPYDGILACQAAATQAEHIVRSIGAERAGSFCSQVKVR